MLSGCHSGKADLFRSPGDGVCMIISESGGDSAYLRWSEILIAGDFAAVGDFIITGSFVVVGDCDSRGFTVVEDFIIVRGFAMVGNFVATRDFERIVINTDLG